MGWIWTRRNKIEKRSQWRRKSCFGKKGCWEIRQLSAFSIQFPFFCGKMFGFRANEQTLLRFSNIFLKENVINFDENISKTFHGGLSDWKRIVRWIKYVGHETGVTHSRCLQSLFRLYLDKIQICVCSIEAFYFRPARDGSFAYETMAVGVNTLSKIFADK